MIVPNLCLRPFLCVVLLATAGCAAGPPVQEMSDARQAIAAAREAGAATLDADGLRSAEARLADAESRLQQGQYWEAKRLAVTAKETAIASLLHSRSVREPGVEPDAAAPDPGPPTALPR